MRRLLAFEMVSLDGYFVDARGDMSWAHTTILTGDAADEVRRLKREAGPGLAVLGSGTVVSRLAGDGLIDEFQLVVIPVVLGAGRTPFAGIRERLDLALLGSRAFANGNVLLRYAPRRRPD